MCSKCWETPDALKTYFIHFDKDSKLIFTDRERIFPVDDIEIDIPEKVAAVQTDGLRSSYLDVVDYMVRPPYPVFNPRAWVLLEDMCGVPSFAASCGFAVRVDAGKPHAVASVVFDDHGRCAMNTVFDSLEEYEAARDQWEHERDKNIAPYAEQVQASFDETRSCDNGLIEKATDSFAVVTRLRRGLSMYYG